MMGSELEAAQPAARHGAESLQFDSKLASDLWVWSKNMANATLIPKEYRGKESDIFVAAQLGVALGVHPIQALQTIDVINGRPTLSARLMAALVRKAGHKLHSEGDGESCTATLTRWDDPEHPFVSTFTFAQARTAGLTGKDVWKFYPDAMLDARANSAVCKRGAPEALLGIALSTEEARDLVVEGELVESPARRGGLAAVRAAVAEPVEAAAPVVVAGGLVTSGQRKEIATAWADAMDGLDPRHGEGLAFLQGVTGNDAVTRVQDLTMGEADALLTGLALRVAELSEDVEDGEVVE